MYSNNFEKLKHTTATKQISANKKYIFFFRFILKSSNLEYFTDPSQRERMEELWKSALEVSKIKAASELKFKSQGFKFLKVL